MHKCLDKQIGVNVEAYVDDVVVKTKRADTLTADLAETFANLRRFQMKLNSDKCVFGKQSRKRMCVAHWHLVGFRWRSGTSSRGVIVLRLPQPSVTQSPTGGRLLYRGQGTNVLGASPEVIMSSPARTLSGAQTASTSATSLGSYV